MQSYTEFASPLGLLTITQEDGYLTSIRVDSPDMGIPRCDKDPVLQLTVRWLRDYFDGKAPDPSVLPIRPQGTAFQHSVWEILRTIPYGSSLSYGELARRLSPRMSAQAVGGAVSRNPLLIVIPCHRILGANGSMTGFSAGLDRKRFLLDLEGVTYSDPHTEDHS
ncbi:MAG: methylated-DNA--[protein]-cysteine S-methyltransferase [Faecousia sp.]